MDKALKIQKQVRDNVKTYNSYLTDLQNWEKEMKRKQSSLRGVYEQVYLTFKYHFWYSTLHT